MVVGLLKLRTTQNSGCMIKHCEHIALGKRIWTVNEPRTEAMVSVTVAMLYMT